MSPDGPLTNNHKELGPLCSAVHYFKMHFKMQWAFSPFMPTEGHSLALSYCLKALLPFKSWRENLVSKYYTLAVGVERDWDFKM